MANVQPQPAPGPDPIMEGQLRRVDIGPLATMASFDLRNGSVEDAISMICKPAIPEAFRWVPIEGLPSDMSIRYADVFIKCAAMQLDICGRTIVDAAVTKKVAIILGTARAVMTEMYRLVPGDLIAGEVAPPMLTYNRAVTPEGNEVVTWIAAARLTEARRTTLLGNFELTEDDKTVMTDILLCSVGLPAVQGASLMATGHHYLSDVREKSRAFYKVIETMHWRKEPTKTWFTNNKEELQDAMWHKAGHPISIQLKMSFAVSMPIAEKIAKAGSGASASRLPAKESTLRAACTVKTLAINVRQFFEHYGGHIETGVLDDAIELTELYIPGVKFAEGVNVYMPGIDATLPKPEGTPGWVVDRNTALKHLGNILYSNQDCTAAAFGFFEAYSEAALMATAAAGEMTLAGANSLVKLRVNCFSAYMRGREAYGDYKTFKAAERAAGQFVPPKLTYLMS